MANYFYFDQTNTKQGPVSEDQLKELVAQGDIGPHTPMETDAGHKGVAGQIPGLQFSTVSVPPAQTAQAAPMPPSAAPKELFCTNCGRSVSEQAVACLSCGAKPVGHRKFCRHCAAPLSPEQVICVKCGAKIGSGPVERLKNLDIGGTGQKARIAYILLGLFPVFFCGIGGIHNLYASRTSTGLIQLIASVVNMIFSVILTPLTIGFWLIIAIPVALGILIWQIVEVCTVTADGNGQTFS